MAAPITAIPEEVFAKEAGSSDDPAAQSDLASVAKVLHLLEEIDKAGWLDVLTATVEQRDSLLGVVVDQAGKPGSVQAVKSLVSLGQVLTSLNPSAVTAIGEGVASGLNRLDNGNPIQVKGIWDVLKASRDPDISRAFSVVLTILKSVGESLRGNE